MIGSILLLLALLLNWYSNNTVEPPSAPETQQSDAEAPPPPPPPSTPENETPEQPADTAESGTEASSTVEETAPQEDASAPTDSVEAAIPSEPAQDPLVDLVVPSFDVVRIDPSGDAVIAGRANAGATVTILDSGSDLGTAEADGRGEWVYLPSKPLEPGPHELKLRADLPDGRSVLGDNTVVLVVPKPGQDIAGRETEAPEAQQPLAVLIPNEDQPGAEVIQAPPTEPDAKPNANAESQTATAEPEGVKSEDGSLSVETIDYDADGNVSIAGKGPIDTTVLAYLDNGLIGTGRVRDDMRWRINPRQEVAQGVYTLRLDAVRGQSVIARLELPFSRAAPLTDLQGEDFIVVQPGNSLWRIARRTLGSGFSYTVIYEANADQIQDPDLIYPGQVFEVPKE